MSTIPETLQQGLKHHRAGELVDAERMYRRVLQMHPRHAGAVHLLGLIAFQIGKVEIAERHLVEAIKLDQFQAAFPADLAEIYRAQGRLDEAVAAYRKSLELNPNVAAAHYQLGTLLQSLGEGDEAAHCFGRAIQLDPRHAEAQLELALLAQREGRLAEAQHFLEAAVQAGPDNALAYLRLGICLSAQGQWHAAIACFEKVLRLDSESAEARYRLGQARLALGDFANGWRDFQWGFRCAGQVRHDDSLPVWNGAQLAGHRLIVHAPASLSDTLQFIRYVPLAIERGADVLLDVPGELATLFAESGFQNIVSAEAQTEAHLQAPLLNLPHVLGTTLETIPARVPYLTVGAEHVARWRERLAAVPGFRVGIAWQGEREREFNNLRSMPLVAFEPLARVNGVRLISLQQANGLDQLPAARERFEIVVPSEVAETGDPMVEMAAIASCCDLVIAADTAVAHLAGALDVPVWVALSTAADWRWLRERADSPWYPSMRLFRQSIAGDWQTLFDEMATALAARVAGG